MLAIACGYPDGNDFNFLRSDPAFKVAERQLNFSGVRLDVRVPEPDTSCSIDLGQSVCAAAG
jgi:hypothetical protein